MVMGQLVDALESSPVEFGETPWLGGLQEKAAQNGATIEPMLNADTMPLGYYRILKEIRDYMPKDSILVADGASTMDISQPGHPGLESQAASRCRGRGLRRRGCAVLDRCQGCVSRQARHLLAG